MFEVFQAYKGTEFDMIQDIEFIISCARAYFTGVKEY